VDGSALARWCIFEPTNSEDVALTAWRDLADRLEGKAPPGASRSAEWSAFRDRTLKGRGCAVCGGRKNLTLHHIIPFHLAPDLELDHNNVIPLCQAGMYGINCHLVLGHLGNWQRTNVNVLADVAYWHTRLVIERDRD
jgi:5-methylcytosine-specific restriction enzyme A